MKEAASAAPVTVLDPRERGLRPSDLARRTERHAAIVVLLALTGSVVAWLRLPPIAHDTLWAEDGRTFLQDALDRGPLGTLFLPYAGYLHTVPRLLADAVVGLPVASWAEMMTAGSCLVAGVLTATVFVCSRAVVSWMPARLMLASLTVLAPLAPREVLGNAANMHSLFLWALFWMLLYRPRTRRGGLALGALALLGALTEIQSVLLMPLLLLRARDRSRWFIRAGYLAGVTGQLIATEIAPRAHDGNPAVPPLSVLDGWLINAVTPIAIPQNAIGPVLASSGPLVGILVLACLAIPLLVILREGTTIQRAAAISLVLGSILFYSVDVVDNPQPFYDYATLSTGQLTTVWLTRYGIVPSMMLLAIVPIGVSIALKRPRRAPRLSIRRPAVFATASLLAVCMIIACLLPGPTRRSFGPTWQPQITAARETCETHPDTQLVLRETIGWHVTVPCALISGRGAP